MGWNPPHRDDISVVNAPVTVYMKHEVLDRNDFEQLFNLDKVGKSGVKLDETKMEYFNSMHLRNRFNYFNEDEKMEAIQDWRNVLLDTMPKELHLSIKKMSNEKMAKVMELMKKRIHFFHEMLYHKYLFETPYYNSELAQKLIKRVK